MHPHLRRGLESLTLCQRAGKINVRQAHGGPDDQDD